MILQDKGAVFFFCIEGRFVLEKAKQDCCRLCSHDVYVISRPGSESKTLEHQQQVLLAELVIGTSPLELPALVERNMESFDEAFYVCEFLRFLRVLFFFFFLRFIAFVLVKMYVHVVDHASFWHGLVVLNASCHFDVVSCGLLFWASGKTGVSDMSALSQI